VKRLPLPAFPGFDFGLKAKKTIRLNYNKKMKTGQGLAKNAKTQGLIR
jgi:hypothetical protein